MDLPGVTVGAVVIAIQRDTKTGGIEGSSMLVLV